MTSKFYRVLLTLSIWAVIIHNIGLTDVALCDLTHHISCQIGAKVKNSSLRNHTHSYNHLS